MGYFYALCRQEVIKRNINRNLVIKRFRTVAVKIQIIVANRLQTRLQMRLQLQGFSLKINIFGL